MVSKDGIYMSRALEQQRKVAHDAEVTKIRISMAVHFSKFDFLPSEIVSGVLIGSVGSAMSYGVLKALKVTHILCVSDYIKPIFPSEFAYKIIAIPDSPCFNIISTLPECFSFIQSALAEGNILIHWYIIFSFAGKSRSISVAIGYLMKTYKLDYDTAFHYVKEKRKVAEPNEGFAMQLQKFNPDELNW